MTTLANLTTDQIKTVLERAGMATAANRNGNAYNQLRAGNLNAVVGTLKAGASARTHKDARAALRKALRDEGVEI